MGNHHSTKRWIAAVGLTTALAVASTSTAAQPVVRPNSLGMGMVEIVKGEYERGAVDGDYDERPVHRVNLTVFFEISVTEVTNAQYEQFDPEHRKLRGKMGLSKDDDEAVIFVSWHDAMRFCEWLSQKEGVVYRLPTEAEWEYVCRAGTTTAFSTGDTLPDGFQKHDNGNWTPKATSLHVGKTEPNAFGVYDMHGNVEEWCLDWYGPYPQGAVVNPAGPRDGEFRVVRGGSHNTSSYYLRSANRMGALPDDRQWLTGFRVVRGALPAVSHAPAAPTPRWAREVSQDRVAWEPLDPDTPYFAGPITFVNIPEHADGPLYRAHNHCPDIAMCPNGDLLATWYTTRQEHGRELAVAAARLRRGASEWDAADLFYKAPDRNMHATAIWFDGDKTLYHFNGIGVSHGWHSLALMFRTSTDNGATWSQPQWINREHQLRNMPIAGTLKTRDGTIIVKCDAVTGGDGGTAIHISRDGGQTWIDPGAQTEPLRPKYGPGVTGGTIAGIHAGVVELADGRLMALGRGDSIDGRMPASYSSDMGKTWTYEASPFEPIKGGQRLVFMRLKEGPLLLVTFANEPREFTTPRGTFRGRGMFAALSMDDGRTWPVQKLITPGGRREVYTGAWNQTTLLTAVQAEPKGYLAATQTPDGVIHLISSGQHYRFNLAWLKQPWDEGD